MFAHVHQVSMVHAVKFVTTVYPIHGNAISKVSKYTAFYSIISVTMVVHVLLRQLVIFVNVHFHILVLTVKESLSFLDPSVLVLFVHVQHQQSPLSIHVYQIHVKTMVVVLLFSTLLDAIAHLVTLVTIVNSVSQTNVHILLHFSSIKFSP